MCERPNGERGGVRTDQGGAAGAPGRGARADWERRIYRRLTDTRHADERMALPAPAQVQATPAVGHVRLAWAGVPDAAGYVIERTDGPDGIPRILDHGGSDVPAVPSTVFADTGLRDDVEYHYRIGAVAGAEYPVWPWSPRVFAHTTVAEPGSIEVDVDASRVVG